MESLNQIVNYVDKHSISEIEKHNKNEADKLIDNEIDKQIKNDVDKHINNELDKQIDIEVNKNTNHEVDKNTNNEVHKQNSQTSNDASPFIEEQTEDLLLNQNQNATKEDYIRLFHNLDDKKLPLEVKVFRSSSPPACPSLCLAYPMLSVPRGSALIINNKEFGDESRRRLGAQVDGASLHNLLHQLGFNVIVHNDLTYNNMMKQIRAFSQLDTHAAADMSIVCILTHGDDGILESTDGAYIKKEWVLEQFNNENCPLLRGKPKFFILQSCSGVQKDYGVARQQQVTFTDALPSNDTGEAVLGRKSVTWEDILIANATVPGYVSYRNHNWGSWFIECICEVFMQQAAETDIEEMLKSVAMRLSKYESEFGTKQSFEWANRNFYKKLYFNPGWVYDKDGWKTWGGDEKSGNPSQANDMSGKPYQGDDTSEKKCPADDFTDDMSRKPCQADCMLGKTRQGDDKSGKPCQGDDKSGKLCQGNDKSGKPCQGDDKSGKLCQGNDKSGKPSQGDDKSGKLCQGNDKSGKPSQLEDKPSNPRKLDVKSEKLFQGEDNSSILGAKKELDQRTLHFEGDVNFAEVVCHEDNIGQDGPISAMSTISTPKANMEQIDKLTRQLSTLENENRFLKRCTYICAAMFIAVISLCFLQLNNQLKHIQNFLNFTDDSNDSLL